MSRAKRMARPRRRRRWRSGGGGGRCESGQSGENAIPSFLRTRAGSVGLSPSDSPFSRFAEPIDVVAQPRLPRREAGAVSQRDEGTTAPPPPSWNRHARGVLAFGPLGLRPRESERGRERRPHPMSGGGRAAGAVKKCSSFSRPNCCIWLRTTDDSGGKGGGEGRRGEGRAADTTFTATTEV